MNKPKSFLYEEHEGIATITLNRPERLNAITFEVYHELTDFFIELRDQKNVRVVVITGAGRAFCSGGDVRDIIGELQGRDAEGLLNFTRLTCELIQNMRALPKPIIASINGTTAGAALASPSLRTFASRPRKQRSLSCLLKSGWQVRTWARRICCLELSVCRRRRSY